MKKLIVLAVALPIAVGAIVLNQDQPKPVQHAAQTEQAAPAPEPVDLATQPVEQSAPQPVVQTQPVEPAPVEPTLTVQELATQALVARGQNQTNITCFATLMEKAGEWGSYQERIDYILGKYISICAASKMYDQRGAY